MSGEDPESRAIRDQLQATLTGTHTLERELGGGGMSRVFVAEEVRLKRKVVVKVLSPELAQGLNAGRFEREIQTAAALQQANIVPVLTTGDSDGLPYYTMPFVDGESLRVRLGRGPLSASEAIGVLRDVSKALAYAHAHGVVHRDIKPDNVLVSGGTAVVTDFGIAKAISASRKATDSAALTQVGTSIGTPAYMAPEQAAGDPDVDHRADIYALGAMGYELLTGQPVFPDRTPQRMLVAHMSEEPRPLAELRPDLPAPLVQLVMSCLAKDAHSRPQQAGEVARLLDAITSGSGMQSLPPVLLGGAAMFRKALALYAAAFVFVAVVAKAAIVGIGLPDWVFPGSLIVMALGLPVVLWTGYVQRVARRALAATPTYTPGGSPAGGHGTIATMALKAAPRMSWSRTARGGMYAMATFVVLIVAFMTMRALGIGPFGSLIASGKLGAKERIVIAEFTASNGDSALGRVVSDAVRAGLADSKVLVLLTSAEVSGALQRMQRDPSARFDLGAAQQVALREGVKAVVDGTVTPVGTSYIVATRLVTADSGRELASFRGTAAGPDAIIDVADDLSRKLREKAGESLRGVRATPALSYATTSSLDALRKYSDGDRANDRRDYPAAMRLLREAVALDSNFAEAWRKLASAMRGARGSRAAVSQAAIDSAIARAFRLSDRLPERERDLVHASYYGTGAGADRARAIATYERMLVRGDSVFALNNLAGQYASRLNFAKAETLFRAAVRVAPTSLLPLNNLYLVLTRSGKLAQADSVITLLEQKSPGSPGNVVIRAELRAEQGRLDEVGRIVDSLRRAADPQIASDLATLTGDLAATRGRLHEAREMYRRREGLDSASGSPRPAVLLAAENVKDAIDLRAPVEPLIGVLDAAIEQSAMDTWAMADRPYLLLARLYAMAGRVNRAKSMMAQYVSAVRDSTTLRQQANEAQYTTAWIELAEGRWQSAAALLRKSYQRPDGPIVPHANINCAACLEMDLLDAFAMANVPDSALAVYEAYRKTNAGSRARSGIDINVGAARTEAIAKIYDAKGDTAKAVAHYREFVDTWKAADPEMQPRVAAARTRLQQLTPVERAGGPRSVPAARRPGATR